MQTIEARKKKYSLNQTEINALREAINVLETIENDDDISEAIRCEVWGSVEDAKDVLLVILRLDKQYLDFQRDNRRKVTIW